MIELILGGTRSGKSHYAEQRLTHSEKPGHIIVTATADDTEMQQRIALHQAQRSPDINVIEAPLQLADALLKYTGPDQCVMVDCLTLWVSNLLLKYEKNIEAAAEYQALLACLPRLDGQILFVSNEINMGVIPLGELNRVYCDTMGRLHQAIAAKADVVTLMVAGIAHKIK